MILVHLIFQLGCLHSSSAGHTVHYLDKTVLLYGVPTTGHVDCPCGTNQWKKWTGSTLTSAVTCRYL